MRPTNAIILTLALPLTLSVATPARAERQSPIVARAAFLNLRNLINHNIGPHVSADALASMLKQVDRGRLVAKGGRVTTISTGTENGTFWSLNLKTPKRTEFFAVVPPFGKDEGWKFERQSAARGKLFVERTRLYRADPAGAVTVSNKLDIWDKKSAVVSIEGNSVHFPAP